MSKGTFEPVKVEPCQNCGFPMKQFNPNSMMMTCESCGTRTGESEAPKHKVVVPRNALFKMHESFVFKGDTWQIIGCQDYSGMSTEWDSEDKVWEKTPWSYYTWWVINAKRELGWITQDKTGYFWSRKTKITSGIPENDKTFERGDWTLRSSVGEFSYFPAENERVRSYEKNGKTLEILLDDDGNNKEIEAFTEEKINNLDLLQGFGNLEALNGIKRIGVVKKVAIACILCLIVGFVIMRSFETLLLRAPSQTFSNSNLYLNQPFELGSISLEESSLIEFSFWSSQKSINGLFEADLVVKDSDDIIVTELEFEFWRESGSDSDGPWVESQFGDAPRIKLPAADTYKLSIVPTKLLGWSEVRVESTITRNIVSVFPIIVALVFLVFLLIFLVKTKSDYIRKSTGLTGS